MCRISSISARRRAIKIEKISTFFLDGIANYWYQEIAWKWVFISTRNLKHDQISAQLRRALLITWYTDGSPTAEGVGPRRMYFKLLCEHTGESMFVHQPTKEL